MLVCEQAEEQAAKLNGAPVLTVMGAGWHPGVIGIVAGRIKERFGRPQSSSPKIEDGTGKGSGRSISGVDLGAAVLAAKDSGLLVAGGGHAMAAGLTLAPGGLEPFRDFINERLAADVEKSRDGRALLLDALLAPGGVAANYATRSIPPDLMAPAGRAPRGRRPGTAAQGRHRRQRPCARHRLRRRRQELQVDRLPQRRNRAWPGSALLARRPALVARRNDQARRMERGQCGRNARGGRRPCLTMLHRSNEIKGDA